MTTTVLRHFLLLINSAMAGRRACGAAARIVEGRVEGGYTDAFELICFECGDHPYLDYSEISPGLQQIRGPYTMRAALAA